jgi:hypothetical protein
MVVHLKHSREDFRALDLPIRATRVLSTLVCTFLRCGYPHHFARGKIHASKFFAGVVTWVMMVSSCVGNVLIGSSATRDKVVKKWLTKHGQLAVLV